MKQWKQARVVEFGAVVVVVAVAFAMVSSTVAVATTTASSAGSAIRGPVSALTPLGGPSQTCTTSVNGENGGDNALQTAITAAGPGATICIGAGTYPEQLTISTPGINLLGAGNTSTIIAPATVASDGQVNWDSTSGVGVTPTVPMFAIILVKNTTGWAATNGVTIEGLEVNGTSASSSVACGDDYVGVDFQDSSGTLTGATVANVAAPTSAFGCQEVSGAVYAYNAYYYTGEIPSPAISVTVSNSTITGYQKNGITCDDLGESCTLSGNTVTGIGPTTLNGQNGIQIGFGASGIVTDNAVSGNHYLGPTGGQPNDVNYFGGLYTATGILVFDGGNTIHITGNELSGNDLGIALEGTPASTVSDNTIVQGYSYGITFDLNASLAYLYNYPIYSTDATWASTAAGDSIENVNVGILSYDDNVTITGGSMSNVNVSIEAVTDDASSSYATTIDDVTAVTNVSGALLGNISSYQATPGMYPNSVGTYTLGGDSFTANTAAPSPGVGDGILINGTQAMVNACQVTGFALGIYVNPTVTSATIEGSTITSTATLGEPVTGIWAGNFVYPTTQDSGTFLITGNTVTGPGGGANSPLAGGTGIVAGGASVTIANNRVSGYSAISGSNGNDWWEGTQSVGVLVGCPTTSTAAACLVQANTIVGNTIGVAVLLTNYSFSTAYDTGPVTITHNAINENTGYGIFTEMDWNWPTAGAPPTSSIDHNTFNNTLTGAPAMVLSGQTFDVTNNLLIGTSTSGDQGPVQGEGGPSINTASIEATDFWTSGDDTVLASANLFLDTSVYWSTSFEPGSPSTLSVGELVTFTESGLPSGTMWSVTADGLTGVVPAPNPVVGDFQNGSYTFTAPSAGGYSPTPSSGGLPVVGTPLTEPIVFSNAKFSVTVTETGLPRGSIWWLYLSTGQAFSTSSTAISSSELNGSYNFSFGITYHWPRDYSAPSGAFTVNGLPVHVSVRFVPVRAMKIVEKGLPAGTEWWVNLTIVVSAYASGLSFHSTGTAITLYLGNGKFTYTFASANKSYASGRQTFSVVPVALTAPRLFSAVFHLVVFPVSVIESGLPAGSFWCVVLTGGATHCSTGRAVSFKDPNGTYAFTLRTTRSGYSQPSGTFTVAGAPALKTVAFAPILYPVTFTEGGLPHGARWCVVVTSGGTYCSTASKMTFHELNGTYTYALTTTRSGYSGPSGTFTVVGAAVLKTVTFTPTGGGGGVPVALGTTATGRLAVAAVGRAVAPSAGLPEAATLAAGVVALFGCALSLGRGREAN
jgi:parallel beta-helix repeat protein